MVLRNKTAIVNEIIKEIYYIDDYTEMRKNFVHAIKSVINCRFANFFVSTTERELDPPVSNELDEDFLLKYLDEYEQDEETSWFYKSGKSVVYREKDLFDMNEIEQSDFYKFFCKPFNVHDALLTCLAFNGKYAGLVTLWREKDAPGFDEGDVFIMDLFKTHLEARHDMEMRRRILLDDQAKISCNSFVLDYGLTVREAQILEHLLNDQTNDEISKELLISINTVKKHVFNIYRKLDISKRSELETFKKI